MFIHSYTRNVTYRHLVADDVYEITIHASSRQATDDLFTVLHEIFALRPDAPMLRILMIEVEDLLPLSYFMAKTRQFLEQHPRRPPTRTVLLYNPNKMVDFLSLMIKMLRLRDAMTAFPHHRRTEALRWLQHTESDSDNADVSRS
jgi:hypothetical protein